MNRLVRNDKITLSAPLQADVDEMNKVLDGLGSLSGSEARDRLIIQDAIDKYHLRGTIMYDGNEVLPLAKTVREYRKYKKRGSIEGMSRFFYDFLTGPCGEIAHFNLAGFIDYFGGSFARVEDEVIRKVWPMSWRTDLIRILDTIYPGEHTGWKTYYDGFGSDITAL